MTVETKTDLSRQTCAPTRASKACRQSEQNQAFQTQEPHDRPDDDIIVAPVTPPQVWPRVFPGL